MSEEKVKLNLILENRLPEFVTSEFPLVSEFLSQYYLSLDSQSLPNDIIQNIDQYVKIDNLSNLIDKTFLSNDVNEFDKTIYVSSTNGFPSSYGLIKIDDEIITYTGITTNSFIGCVRGFSAVTSYENPLEQDQLIFSTSNSSTHKNQSTVENLSILFLKIFFKKLKKQIAPGFENEEFYEDLDEGLFIKNVHNFYESKGTDVSFKILFKALYGEPVQIIKPRDFLIRPSDAQYTIFNDLVVESIDGDPFKLVNSTLIQDEDDFFTYANGTVANIEKITRNDKNYYIMSLDYDYNRDIDVKGTQKGKFSIHPQTNTLSHISANSTFIDVDSTVGFPNSGSLIVDLDNGTTLNITYGSKSLTQFLDCSGIAQNISELTKIKLDAFAYGYYFDEIIKVRVLGVLSDIEIPNNTSLYSKEDIVRIKTLGIDLKDSKYNNWFFNFPLKYNVKSINLIPEDDSDKTYKITLEIVHSFQVGDTVLIASPSISEEFSGTIISTSLDKKSFTIEFGSLTNFEPSSSLVYIAKRAIEKVDIENYSYLGQYNANVQNVYFDSGDNSLHIASPSLPKYKNKITINERLSKIISISNDDTLNIGPHGFYNGDSVIYMPSANSTVGISTGKYFVKRISDTEIKLARSKYDLFRNSFIESSKIELNSNIQYYDYVSTDFKSKKLENQKLIRKISEPEDTDRFYETLPGTTGIFINGVELLNYKSKDYVYYGPIQDIFCTSSGDDYDIINPPTLTISDEIGYGASCHCSVIGSLKRIDIIDPGFDYIDQPRIEIFGGNGSGAKAKVNLVTFDHEVEFNSQSSSGAVQLNPLNKIGFSTYHNFRKFDEVVYITNSQKSVGGLSTNSTYYVKVENETEIKLHKSITDANIGINTVVLSSYGEGNHIFRSKNKKKKIGSINIEDGGKNYQNKLTITNHTGINTSSDKINIKNHGYNSGEIVVYHSTDIPIGGLSSTTSYIVTKIDSDSFKLSKIGISTLGFTSSFYYESSQYVNLTSVGRGLHKFNYPPISVEVIGKIGISTEFENNSKAIVNPVFRGGIQSVFVDNGGYDYGSEEIINYDRQPSFNLNSGSGIQLTPVISESKIVKVLINSSGANYNSPPTLKIIGDGAGAILTPIFSNGSLTEVKVISGGLGYNENNTRIQVIPAGNSAKFRAKIKSWNINLVERLVEERSGPQIGDDDGILISGSYGLEYTHAYSPRPLRSLVGAVRFENGEEKYESDLSLSTDLDRRELMSESHSPIIGWAYDGNPIYGPYGYSNLEGDYGKIRLLKSGYEKLTDVDDLRPSVNLYPVGVFVEDYVYSGNGDLDEHNGRFAVTPEYPNGVYAYFSTINSENSSFGIFRKYKRPVFPYIIGQKYKSKPIEFNFSLKNNQDYIDINATGWKRNTTPYGILNEIDTYEYVNDDKKTLKSISNITQIFSGRVDSIDIISAGLNYKIGDSVNFEGSSSDNCVAKISHVQGKPIAQIGATSYVFENVEFCSFNEKLIGFTSIPHGYLNNDIITIESEYIDKDLQKINVFSNLLTITSGVSTVGHTGIITYFNVNGNLTFPNIRENDIYEIGTEKIKILNIDEESSRIRVLRNYDGTVALSTHYSGNFLREISRKFNVNFGISTTSSFNLNKEIYFNPSESVGLGTIHGVGIVSTIYISNAGVGNTMIVIPTKTIYIKDHNLKTGDLLSYNTNGGSSIGVSTDGINSFSLSSNTDLYALKVSNNLIGISTLIPANIDNSLYFISEGSGINHSFKTNIDNILNAEVSKNIVTITTEENHELELLDNITVNVKSGLSTSISVLYDDHNRRMVINPRSFSESDTENGLIKIDDHGYFTGQKVIYTSSNPPQELISGGIYYTVKIGRNKIKLAESYYDSTKRNPSPIEVSSSFSGTISPINPQIKVLKDQTIVFDLSDPTLSFFDNLNKYPAFDFNIYTDESFVNIYNSSGKFPEFDVLKEGKIGIDSTAKLSLKVHTLTPKNLYYKLTPISLDRNFDTKKEIFIDNDAVGFCKIFVGEIFCEGTHKIVGVSSSTFTYNTAYVSKHELGNVSEIEYYTNSPSAKGPIKDIKILKGGKYNILPHVTSISSELGKNSILKPTSNSIGKIKNLQIEDIGFDYSADYSVRPLAKFPEILELETKSSLGYVGITSFGRGYRSIASLILIDGLTNKVVEDVELTYFYGDSKLTIIKNSNSINNVTPKIIPINNTNGVKVQDISFNPTNKDVTVTLGSSFSSFSEFPFFVGGKILIEGTSVGLQTEGRGFNSSNYEYALFVVTNINPLIGGSGATVTYNMSSYLEENQFPGTFDPFYSSGRITPEEYFPSFNPVLKRGDFYTGETVYSEDKSLKGSVLYWDAKNSILKISTINDFSIGDTIIGRSSNSVGVIKNRTDVTTDYIIASASEKKKGWKNEVGFLNNDFQRIHDNNYYQYFSYDLKSKVDLSKWDETVDKLNHTVGFKKFSNLILETEEINSGISTEQDEGDFLGITDLSSFVNLNCIHDFDLAKENNLIIDNSIKSDEIILNSRVVQDYIESIGNRVLMIDDISDKFNSLPRSTVFSVVDSFLLSEVRSKKYIASIVDKFNYTKRQTTAISLIHNNQYGFINQYGVESYEDLGFFDFSVSDNLGNLLFYPVKNRINDYYIGLFSFTLKDIVSGIGTLSLGDSVKVETSTVTIPQGTSSAFTLVGIASTYSSSKVLVQIGAANSSYYEYQEIDYLHDGVSVHTLEYGSIHTNNLLSRSSSGIGTYNVRIDGTEVLIDIIPNNTTDVDYIANTISVSIANTSSTGIGTQILSDSKVSSNCVQIESSPSPEATPVFSYSVLDYDASYFIIKIQDITNSQGQLSEFLLTASIDHSYLTEYGVIQSENTLGVITSGISGPNAIIYFTPIEDIEVDVKVFAVSLGFYPESAEFPLNNGSLNYHYGTYVGTHNDIKRSFELYHKNLPIFRRGFDSSDLNIVNIENNTIKLPNHFYVSGEKVKYDYLNSSSIIAQNNSPIGIATTFISGIGNTDKLPSTLYIVKVDDVHVRVSASASDALRTVPKTLSLNSTGIGSHSFISTKQNSKSLICIDNVIQSPISETAYKSNLIYDVNLFDFNFYLSNVNSIYSGDLLKIDDEIVRVVTVGVGSTNAINVIRGWMGTGISTHSNTTLTTKLYGNYNIINNTIHFSEPPHGKNLNLYGNNRYDEVYYVGIVSNSSFSGRVFMKNSDSDTLNETYGDNYVFDDISDQFDATLNTFTVKSNGLNITGISTDNSILLINDIFQTPSSLVETNDYEINEYSGITSVSFTGFAKSTSYDVNTSSIPRGGIILSVGSTQGFGYQPLVSAGGTAIVSSAGTIQGVSIGNSGSGYRSGIQEIINIAVQTSDTIEFVGIATSKDGNVVSVAITNPGIGYTNYSPLKTTFNNQIISIGSTIIPLQNTFNISAGNYISLDDYFTNVRIVGVGSTSILIGIGDTVPNEISIGRTCYIKYYNPPSVIFDPPLSYSNIPLIYSQESNSGNGEGAVIDIVVGQGSSIISYELKNLGYSYKPNEILTVSVGGTVGIPTFISSDFSEFKLTIDKTHHDTFSSWTVGNLQIIDSINSLFNGIRRTFPIRIGGNQTTIRAKKGSNINIEASLLVFINDIIQIPRESYIFNGGSLITFTEAPKMEDRCSIVFYRGTKDIDTVSVDILETIKVGDDVTLKSDDFNLNENERLVVDIISSDILNTNLYSGPGISQDSNLLRPLTLCMQSEDLFIGSEQVTKDRIIYEPYIRPVTNIIKDVDYNSSEIFVESVRAFFDSEREYKHDGTNEKPQNKIIIISQDSLVTAISTAIVSSSGTISSINIVDGGVGYTTSPYISISNPIGIGSTGLASAIAFIDNGTVTSVDIITPGFGYDPTNPPLVLFESPSVNIEEIDKVSYYGDHGIITGINTVTVGIATTGIVFDFFIPPNSIFRDSKTIKVGIATTGISGIQTGDYFVVKNSNIGNGVTSLNNSGNVIGIGSSFLDNIYQVSSVSIGQTTISGIGITHVAKVTVIVSGYNNLSGLGFGSFYGDYSWGKILTPFRKDFKKFEIDSQPNINSIASYPIVQRYNRLKYIGYSTT